MSAPETDKRLQVEILISNLLRIGVIISLSVIVIGTVLSFAHHPDYLSSKDELHRLTTQNADFPNTLGEMTNGLRQLQGRSVVVLGLLLLIATPVMRVAVSVFAFVYERDVKFVIITTVVLILLLISFALNRGG